jgi:hypothetical protein
MLNVISAANKNGNVIHNIASKDTIIKLDSVRDRKLLRLDKKKPANDTIPRDTAKRDTGRRGGLESEVTATSEDSSYTDNEKDILYLWGKAHVKYEEFELDADYIRVDRKKHLIFSSGRLDPKTRRYTGRPIAKMGKEEKPVASDSLFFDYTTKKGVVYNSATEQEGNYLSGGKVKRLNETEIALSNVLFSTCDLPRPDTHFGFVITKGIAEKNRIISGPVYLEIADVPLPIAAPFGFFPKPDRRASGVMLPSFGEDQKLGFFLRDFGYYIGISDYIDLTNQATFYSKGSYEVGTTARYLKRYTYQGSLALRYGSHKYGLEGDPAAKDFNVTWSHSQDPSAHPGSTFSASVNAGTSTFYSNNPATTNYSFQALTQNNLRSTISYGKTWAGTPFNFTSTLSHAQDLTRKTVTLELPTFSFNMSTISPLDSKNRVGEQKWYQKLTVGYSLQGTNKLNDIPESQLFKKETLSKRLQNGFVHNIPVGLSMNVLRYFQFNTGGNYTERWYFQTINKRYERGVTTPVIDTIPGFKRAGEYSLNAGLTTKIYSEASFSGRIRKIRHVMTPSISFNYRPDFGDPSYGYYRTAVSSASIPSPYTYQRYSIFEQGVYGGPGAGRTAGIGFNLDNTIEAKVRAKSTDTSQADKKIPILQGLTFSTFYNFAADSMRLSPFNVSGHTSIFNQKVNINFGGQFEPYAVRRQDSIQNNQIVRTARRINRLSWQDGKLPMLTNFNFSMDMSLNSDAFKKGGNTAARDPNTLQNMSQQQADKLAAINYDPAAYIDFNVPWNIVLNYNFNFSNNLGLSSSATSTLNVSGDISITPKWKIQYTTGYDLRVNQISPTSLSIYRDLHCWDLSFRWIPFGYYKFYSVDLRVKASILQDLKLSKRKDYYSNL